MREPGYVDLNEQNAETRVTYQRNWAMILFMLAAPVVAATWLAWDLALHGFRWANFLNLFFMYLACGLGITAGYHRYFSHRAYDAHPLVQLFFLIFGAASAQNTLLIWASNHRYHHRYTDTELDPYDIKKGFFFAHMGWLFYRDQPNRPFQNSADLKKNRLVMWQHRNYWWILLSVGFGLPMLIGALYGSPWSGLLWGGLLRMVLTHHSTFLINSYAHTFGKKSHSSHESARDSLILALLSLGEGYHNFHHSYPSDYRNGAAWYHWDPTKWFVAILQPLGLTHRLRRMRRRSVDRSVD